MDNYVQLELDDTHIGIYRIKKAKTRNPRLFMNHDPVVKIRNVGKKFNLYEAPQDRLKEWLSFSQQNIHKEFWALKDISLEIKKGECIGIIGENGAGKSTLMKILTGTLCPTTGSIEIVGRVLTLLELGTGFDMELTGKQNIINMASLLGFPSDYITQNKLGLIEKFADIGEFFNLPVKTFSTGMHIRLAFSMFMFMEPDIFIIDEALSVGDIFFSQKCFTRIRELMAKNVTIIFVSHDLNAVRNLSNKVMLLKKGECSFQGNPEEAITRYTTKTDSLDKPLTPKTSFKPLLVLANKNCGAMDSIKIFTNSVLDGKNRHGHGGMEIIAARIQNEDNEDTLTIPIMDSLNFYILIKAHRNIHIPRFGISIFDRMNNMIFGKNTLQLGIRLPDLQAGEEILHGIKIKMTVQPGQYTINLNCGESDENSTNPNSGRVCDWHESIGPLNIVFDYSSNRVPFNGMANLPMTLIE